MTHFSIRVSACALLLAAGGAAQEVPVILQVAVENYVVYINDVSDVSRLARTPGPQTPNPPANFFTNVILADVTAINGSPAKGIMVLQTQALLLTPSPNPGQAVADMVRGTTVEFKWEFLKPDGSAIGNIYVTGLSGGAAAPGSLPGTGGAGAIVGGTGPFMGARGTCSIVQTTGVRLTSQAEDPSLRRTNGGGRGRVVFQIFPLFRPEILIGPDGPVVFHEDYSLVTPGKPARAGEILIVYARGLGPTRPAVNPGDPFPDGPAFAVVNSPVEVLVNGTPSPAINQLGVPTTTDTYRVDFRLPADTRPGLASIQISAAWVRGAAVRVPVQ